jgi:hypothetical protein
LTKCFGYSEVSENYPQATNFSHIKNTETNLDLSNATLGYGYHFQHRNSKTVPIESFEHNSGRTLVRAKDSYPEGSKNTNT